MSSSSGRAERGFFLAMTALIGVVILVAFGSRVLVGETSFTSLPLWFHLHAVPMVGWIALINCQAWLVWRGDLSAHRRIGKFGAILAGYMVVSGWIFTPTSVIWRGAGSPEAISGQVGFLTTNLINITVFGLFVLAAILLRGQSAWHRRLMLCATVLLAGVAWFRIALMFVDGDPFSSSTIMVTGHFAVCMIGDMVIIRRFHPAWILGAAAWWGNILLTGWLTASPIGAAIGRTLFS